MNITPQQAQKLLISNYKSSQLGFSMLLTRLKGLFAKDPKTLQSCTVEINTFLQKYAIIMEKEYSTIINL